MDNFVTNDEVSTALDSWKAFRKENASLNTPEIKSLLKAYQNEIDNLSKKMKFSENTFISLFKVLSEAPDPEPFLSRLLEEKKNSSEDANLKLQISKLQNENVILARKLQKTKEIEDEKNQLKDQLDKTNEKMDGLVSERVLIREHELKEEAAGLIQYLKNREKDLQQQLSESNHNLELLRDNHNMTQEELMELSQSKDRDLTIRVAEIGILQADFDRANSKVISLSNENNSLKTEIKALKEGVGASSVVVDLHNRIKNQEDEISRLVAEIDNSMQESALSESRITQKVIEHELELSSKVKEIEKLSSRLEQQKDYDEIKRELDIIKSVEFSSSWDVDDPEASRDNKDPKDKLEKMLIVKNQQLQNSLTDTKNKLVDSIQELKNSSTKLKLLESELEEKSALISKLEHDLISIGSKGDNNSPSSENHGDSAMSNRKNGDNPGLLGKGGKLADANKNKSSEAAIIPIITGQRDRFRQKNFELEEELQKQHSLAAELQEKIERLEQDNVGLFQQIRYLRSYSSNSAGLGSSSTAEFSGSSDSKKQGNGLGGISFNEYDDSSVITFEDNVEFGIKLGELNKSGKAIGKSSFNIIKESKMGLKSLFNKYNNLYEESLNPFKKFKNRESNRKYNSMSLFDRFSLHMSRIFSSKRWHRLLIVLYVILIHYFLVYNINRYKTCRERLIKN
ncbi:Protein CASP [Smittium culicis]|uniref:Protein CASP n=1 Tax=Smittium culicis TaxID=133412 RepID=A0A1R1Y096_9FUNG|nr:Protein CASP [Smittium culicis]